jgi:hypothetical protein
MGERNGVIRGGWGLVIVLGEERERNRGERIG